ncbi:catalase active site-containing protein, partial [Tanacetum coccineum]
MPFYFPARLAKSENGYIAQREVARCAIERENDLNQLRGRYRSFSPDRQQRFICRIVGAPSDPCVSHECAIERENDLNQLRGRYRSFSPDRQQRFICRIVGAPCDPCVSHEEHVLSPLQYLQEWDMYVSSIYTRKKRERWLAEEYQFATDAKSHKCI